MSYEVFDDVAFYYLVTSLLSVCLFPPTIYMIASCVYSKIKPQENVKKNFANTTNYEAAGTKLEIKQTFGQKYFKLKYFVFIVLWIIFIVLLTQLSQYKTTDLATFKPYEILEVEPDADDSTLKKAYRKLSLKWHPDKNPENSEEAEQEFIKVSKAYKMLTDPSLKEKFDMGEGTKGGEGQTSYTIGLPSYLTKEENSLKVLLVYFLFMIMLPPVCVFLWWRQASEYHETGALRDTINLYFHYMTEQLHAKYLVEILAASTEYRNLQERDNTQEAQAARHKLKVAVKEDMVKQKLSGNPAFAYIERGSVLLHAYLMRKEIPAVLQEDLKILLKDAHRLLGVMYDVAMARKYFKPANGCIELMQLLTQAIWFNENPLHQLPFLTSKEIRMSQRKNLHSLDRFKAATLEKKMKTFSSPSEGQWKEIERVANELPDMKMEHTCVCEDEEGVYEDDIVTLTVTLTRLRPGQIEMAGGVIRSAPSAEDDGDDDGNGDIVEVGEAGETDANLIHPGEDDDLELIELDNKESNLLETLPVAKAKPSRFAEGDGKLVHAPFFPYPKHERWMLMLMEKTKKTTRPIAVQKVPRFIDTVDVEIHIRVGQKGVWPYEVQAKCDSYVGCDISLPFKITVMKMSAAERTRREDQLQKGKEHGLDEAEDEEEEEEEGVWYYCYFSSFWEMVFNLIVLAVLLVFAVNFLQTRGYWQKFVQPVLDIFYKALHPIYIKVYSPLAPYVDPMVAVVLQGWDWLAAKLTVDADELIRLKEQQEL